MPKPSKQEPAYWRERLFKNSFTYKGRRAEVASWSVKIQLFGKRKAFTLLASDRIQAAGEACQIYQTIVDRGWEAVNGSSEGARKRIIASQSSAAQINPFDVEYWKGRLIQRKYPEASDPQAGREFSVRIEHAHTNHYFPLATSNESEAANRAMCIYTTVVNQGWDVANARFPRELSLALRWQDNPLAWTYTTIHTRPQDVPSKLESDRTGGAKFNVAFVEPDPGIRLALAACANRQQGFRCGVNLADAKAALREMTNQRVDLVVANHDLPDDAGTGLEELQRRRPGLAVLSYSVFEDADQLFKSTPGGSVVYMLKRTPPWRLFEPIADLTGPLTREQIDLLVRNYFQFQSALLPAGPPFWKLAKLTPRELEILAFLSKGDLLKEIADKLGISNWTVQGHVKSIFEKLKVHTRTEAVIKYLQK